MQSIQTETSTLKHVHELQDFTSNVIENYFHLLNNSLNPFIEASPATLTTTLFKDGGRAYLPSGPYSLATTDFVTVYEQPTKTPLNGTYYYRV